MRLSGAFAVERKAGNRHAAAKNLFERGRAVRVKQGADVDWRLVVATAIAACVGAGVGTFAVLNSGGGGIEHPSDAKMLEMSVAILREPARVDDDPLRSWAVKVVEKKSGVSFTDQQRAALLKRAATGR